MKSLFDYKNNMIISAVLFAATFFLYANTFTPFSDGHFDSNGNDGIEYAMWVDQAENTVLFNPHHLLYHMAGRSFHQVVQKITGNPAIPSVWSLKLISSLCGAFGIGIFYLLLLQLGNDREASFMASLGLAFSTGYWFFSSTAETYIIDAFFTVLILYVLIRFLKGHSPAQAFIWLGLLHALAICFRLDNVFFVVPVFVIIMSSESEKSLKIFIYYLSSVFVTSLIIYAAVYLSLKTGPKDIVHFLIWCTRDNFNERSSYCKLANFNFKGISNTVLGVLLGINVGILYLSAIFTLPTIYMIIRNNIKKSLSENRIIAICFLWVLARVLFYTWYNPHESFLWSIRSLIPIMIIFSFLMHLSNSGPHKLIKTVYRALCWGVITMMFVSNIMVFAPLRTDSFHRFALNLQNDISKNDLIITDNWSVNLAVNYYSSLESVYLPDIMLRSEIGTGLVMRIDSVYKKGGIVYVLLKDSDPLVFKYLKDLDNNFKNRGFYLIKPEIEAFRNLKKLDFRRKGPVGSKDLTS